MSPDLPWGKLYEKTFEGSMYGSGPVVFSVWCYAIAHMRPPNGSVKINPRSLADTIGCSVSDIIAALDILCGPDPHSDSQAQNGRRLMKLSTFEYVGVNFERYRSGRQPDERRQQNRESQARYRASKVIPAISHGQPPSAAVSPGKPKQKQKQKQIKTGEAPQRSRGSRLPLDWELPTEWAEWAIGERPDLSPQASADKFKDYWHGKAGKDGIKLDWKATWRNWVRTERSQPAWKQPAATVTVPSSGASQTADYLRKQSEAAAKATPPPASVLALRSKRAPA